MPKIKEKLERLRQLGAKMRDQATSLGGPQGARLRDEVQKEAARAGVGLGIALLGSILVTVASVYMIACIILVVNIALDRLWLSALIVVGGFLVIGGMVVIIGTRILRSSAREIPGKFKPAASGVLGEIRSTADEMKGTVTELQSILKSEAEERKRQLRQAIESAKHVVPILIGSLLTLRVIRKIRRRRKARAPQREETA
jgi:hypothetical protein